jgi:hypothetical protein
MPDLPLAPVHEVHNSERMSFRGCRRRWNWVFQERWYPPLTPKPLEFGVAYHKAMEVYYDPETWPSTENGWSHELNALASVGAFVETCEEQRTAYLRHLRNEGTEGIEPEVQADYDERLELGKGMLRYYFDNVAPKEDQGIRPVKAEVSFAVPILRPDVLDGLHTQSHLVSLMQSGSVAGYQLRCNSPKCAGRHVPNAPVVFAGRFDLLMEDHVGGLWVLDWKTATRLSSGREEFLETDNAISAYCWAMFAMGAEMRGFLYHEEKKAFPEPPKMNSSARLGRWFSVNKQQSTSVDLFVQTVREQDTTAYERGLYDEYIEFLKWQEKEPGGGYYARYQVHRSEKALLNAGRYISQEACDMIAPDLRIYPQPGRFSCTSCAFRQPCIGQTNDEDYMYTLATMFDRRDHYWVRDQASTETKGGE